MTVFSNSKISFRNERKNKFQILVNIRSDIFLCNFLLHHQIYDITIELFKHKRQRNYIKNNSPLTYKSRMMVEQYCSRELFNN